MENYETIHRLADILYQIYLKTYVDRKISETNCAATQELLQLSNEYEDRYITNGSEKRSEKECCCKTTLQYSKSDGSTPLENQFAEDIEIAITKAKNVRLNDKKDKSPYMGTKNGLSKKSSIPRILSNAGTKAPSTTSVSTLKSVSKPKLLNKFTNNQHLHKNSDEMCENLQTKNKFIENSKKLSTMKTKSVSGMKLHTEHLSNCPKNKNSKASSVKTDLISKSRVSLGYPASLENIRIPSEIQRALKLYYKFVNDKDTLPVNKKLKMKSLFLQKLDTMNSQNWDLCQKEDFKKMFELNVYINTYESHEDNTPSTLCKFYTNTDTLLGFQQSVNKHEKIIFFKDIFSFLNTDVIDYLQSTECSRNILPLLYKCIMGIVNVYNNGKFQNVAVVRA